VRCHDRLRAFLLFTLVVMCVPAPAAAQWDPFNPPRDPKHVDVSGSAGMRLSTDWSDLILLGSVSPVTGAFEQVLARDLVFVPGPVFDATVMYWEGRYGFRAHGGFSRRCLAVGTRCGAIATLGGPTRGSVDVDASYYDVGGAVGLVDYRRNPWVWPYVFFGLGGVTYDVKQTVSPPLQMFIESRPPVSPQITVATDRRAPLLISIDELGLETKFAVNFGLGTDFRIPLGAAGVGLRLELSDNVHESPLRIRIAEVNGRRGDDVAQPNLRIVHNLRASAGVVLHFGR
jgi:opacity protein-like surface antigen